MDVSYREVRRTPGGELGEEKSAQKSCAFKPFTTVGDVILIPLGNPGSQHRRGAGLQAAPREQEDPSKPHQAKPAATCRQGVRARDAAGLLPLSPATTPRRSPQPLPVLTMRSLRAATGSFISVRNLLPPWWEKCGVWRSLEPRENVGGCVGRGRRGGGGQSLGRGKTARWL